MLYALIGSLSVGSILISTLILYAACVVAARPAEAGGAQDREFLRRVHQKDRIQA